MRFNLAWVDENPWTWWLRLRFGSSNLQISYIKHVKWYRCGDDCKGGQPKWWDRSARLLCRCRWMWFFHQFFLLQKAFRVVGLRRPILEKREQQPTINNQQTTKNNQQPTINNQRPAINNQQQQQQQQQKQQPTTTAATTTTTTTCRGTFSWCCEPSLGLRSPERWLVFFNVKKNIILSVIFSKDDGRKGRLIETYLLWLRCILDHFVIAEVELVIILCSLGMVHCSSLRLVVTPGKFSSTCKVFMKVYDSLWTKPKLTNYSNKVSYLVLGALLHCSIIRYRFK